MKYGMPKPQTIKLLAALVVLLGACQQTTCHQTALAEIAGQATAFALVGDNPYVDFNEPKYERLLDDINANPDISWTLHVGDLKSSSLGCSNKNLMDVWQKHSRLKTPFVLTPGDNDWFDCKRRAAGNWNRRERLAFIRKSWYPMPGNMDGLPVVSQGQGSAASKTVSKTVSETKGDFSDYVENVWWQQSGVVFANIHLVGITGLEGGIDIHGEMMAAALAWLEEVFRVAHRSRARGLFIATQADPWLFTAARDVMDFFCADCPRVRPGYEALDEALVRHSTAFEGQVVLAVGDTHIFRVDKPLYDGEHLVHNFTRVEAYGHPSVHWVKVVVNPASRHLFEFHQQLVPGNMNYGWEKQDKDATER